jgi:rod shape-determining protein MreC
MIKKKEAASYFAIALTLFVLLQVPKERFSWLRSLVLLPGELFASFGSIAEGEMELIQLRLENQLLKEQILEVKEWLSLENRIEEQCEKIQGLLEKKEYKTFYERRIEEMKKILEEESFGVVAKVIFRDPAFWSSGLWVDKGEETNRYYGKKIISKNSPVVVGTMLVGIVEEVEEDRSYIRLITDSSLTPAVRVLRHGEQDRALLQAVEALEYQYQLREDLNVPTSFFEKLKERLSLEEKSSYLAKGEVRGSSATLWRTRRSLLRGVGFNYEFSDREGEALELHEKRREPLLKIGDLLVTSGLDGLFPPHLLVANITKIFPLKEGAVSFDLEAEMCLSDIDSLRFLQILLPL